jgi:anti-sigma factor RsiW
MFCIAQPPLDNYSCAKLTADELMAFVDDLISTITEAQTDSARYNPGIEQCRFCPAAHTCRPRYDLSTAEAQRVFKLAEKVNNGSVTQEEKAKLATMLTDLEQVKKSLFANITADIMNGIPVPGWKLVAGRSIRKWSDEEAAMKYLLSNKAINEEQMFESKFITPSKAEKLNRSLKKSDDFKALITKPMGKPLLVKESDKRPDYDLNAVANAVFSNSN